MDKNFLKIKKLENKVSLGFFTSRGGISQSPYFSLNCNKNSKDKKTNVTKNINIALKQLNLTKKKLKLINQIHSNKIVSINNNNFNNKFSGDGLITNQKNIALGVLTADCAPIFIFDINKKIVCCIHSGWKGALSNIVEKGIKLIRKKKIKNTDIIVIIGPCLSFQNFEVNKNFKLKFIKKNNIYRKFFKSKNANKDLFNLRGLINFQFKNEGVKNIYNIRKDTYKNSQLFFSHRRATHQNKIETGRMINIISIKT